MSKPNVQIFIYINQLGGYIYGIKGCLILKNSLSWSIPTEKNFSNRESKKTHRKKFFKSRIEENSQKKIFQIENRVSTKELSQNSQKKIFQIENRILG